MLHRHGQAADVSELSQRVHIPACRRKVQYFEPFLHDVILKLCNNRNVAGALWLRNNMSTVHAKLQPQERRSHAHGPRRVRADRVHQLSAGPNIG